MFLFTIRDKTCIESFFIWKCWLEEWLWNVELPLFVPLFSLFFLLLLFSFVCLTAVELFFLFTFFFSVFSSDCLSKLLYLSLCKSVWVPVSVEKDTDSFKLACSCGSLLHNATKRHWLSCYFAANVCSLVQKAKWLKNSQTRMYKLLNCV